MEESVFIHTNVVLGEKLSVHIVSTSNQMFRAIDKLRNGRRLVFSDAFTGTWKPHHMAAEMAEQLGLTINIACEKEQRPAFPQGTDAVNKNFFSFSSFVGKGIDDESKGPIDTLFINQYINQIEETFHDKVMLFAVLLPANNHFFSSDSILFISKLKAALSSTDHKLILFASDQTCSDKIANIRFVRDHSTENDTCIPRPSLLNELLYFIPGVLDRTIIQSFGGTTEGLYPVSNSKFVVPFEFRKQATDFSARFLFDELASNPDLNDWLSAFANANGNIFFLNRKSLAEFAWKVTGIGCYDLGFLYLNYLYDTAADVFEKSVISAQIQGLYISLWQFDKVAASDIIEGNVPYSLRLFQFLAKGWGAVMLNDYSTAERNFRAIEDLLPEEKMDSSEYLYYLNIYALLDFKSGRVDDALKKEKVIEEAIGERPDDYRLYFVNKINQARIYRHLNLYTTSYDCYKMAFHSVDGIKKESDLVYNNFVLGRALLDCKKNNDGFIMLIRSALHWLACKSPDLISKRLKVNVRYDQEKDGLFRSFFSKHLLEALKKTCCDDIMIPGNLIVTFTALKTNCIREKDLFFIADESITIGYKKADAIFPPEDFAEDKDTLELGKWIGAYLAVKKIITKHPGLQIFVDNHSGNEMPDNKACLFDYLISNNINHIQWKGIRVDIENEYVNEPVFIGFHPAIKEVSLDQFGLTISVSFKRYLSPLTFTDPEEILLLQAVKQHTEKVQTDILAKETGIFPKRIIEMILNNLHAAKVLKFFTA